MVPTDPAEPHRRAATPDDITRLLGEVRVGAVGAEERLVGVVYHELRQLAASRLRGERGPVTVGPTALVHEAWLRLGLTRADFEDRAHFFGAASRVMRQALVDRARRRKRREPERGPDDGLAEVAATTAVPAVDLLAIDEALQALEQLDERMARIVQLRYFAGLSVEETAGALGLSERTVKREWNVARSWLAHRLGGAAQG